MTSSASHINRDNEDSLRQFNKLVNVLTGAAVLGIVVALLVLGFNSIYLILVLLICICAFHFAKFLTTWLLKKDDRQKEMRAVSDAIREVGLSRTFPLSDSFTIIFKPHLFLFLNYPKFCYVFTYIYIRVLKVFCLLSTMPF